MNFIATCANWLHELWPRSLFSKCFALILVTLNMACTWFENVYIVHNITHLMTCIHGPSNRFDNKDSGCQNPTTSYRIWSQSNWTHLISWVMLYGWKVHYKIKLLLTDMSASTFFAVASCNFLTYPSPVMKSSGLEDLHTWDTSGLPNQRGKEEKEQYSSHFLQCFLVSGPSFMSCRERGAHRIYSCTMCFVCTISIKLGLMYI